MNQDDKKSVNFEVNLLPVISLLAVCISFLLLTTVWIHIGTLDVKQALGETSQEQETQDKTTLWLTMDDSGDMILQLKNSPQENAKSVRFRRTRDGINWQALEVYTESLKKERPEITTALVLPDRQSSFESLIKSIDILKKSNIQDVGIAPL